MPCCSCALLCCAARRRRRPCAAVRWSWCPCSRTSWPSRSCPSTAPRQVRPRPAPRLAAAREGAPARLAGRLTARFACAHAHAHVVLLPQTCVAHSISCRGLVPAAPARLLGRQEPLRSRGALPGARSWMALGAQSRVRGCWRVGVSLGRSCARGGSGGFVLHESLAGAAWWWCCMAVACFAGGLACKLWALRMMQDVHTHRDVCAHAAWWWL